MTWTPPTSCNLLVGAKTWYRPQQSPKNRWNWKPVNNFAVYPSEKTPLRTSHSQRQTAPLWTKLSSLRPTSGPSCDFLPTLTTAWQSLPVPNQDPALKACLHDITSARPWSHDWNTTTPCQGGLFSCSGFHKLLFASSRLFLGVFLDKGAATMCCSNPRSIPLKPHWLKGESYVRREIYLILWRHRSLNFIDITKIHTTRNWRSQTTSVCKGFSLHF